MPSGIRGARPGRVGHGRITVPSRAPSRQPGLLGTWNRHRSPAGSPNHRGRCHPQLLVQAVAGQYEVEVGRRALTEQGIDDGVLVEAKRAMLGNPRSRLRSPRAKELRQEIRFCTSFDGTRIAYATVGEGPPIVKASNWLTHLEFDWESPVWRHVFTELSRDHRLIRYDERGNGLSDWDVEDISFDAFYRDLESVVDTLRLDRFALWGISKGASVSAAYAARHPDRVSHLILVGGFATGRLVEVSEQRRENEMAMRTLMRASWGADNPAFRNLFTGTFIPNATPDHVKWFNDLQRISASPDNALRLRIAAAEIDVRSLLPDIEAQQSECTIRARHTIRSASDGTIGRLMLISKESPHFVEKLRPCGFVFGEKMVLALEGDETGIRDASGERQSPLKIHLVSGL